MKKWDLSGAKVIGGMRPLDPKVPFAHARVVLRKHEADESPGEECLLVYRYPSPEVAEGDPMTLGEWQALIAAGEAHELEQPLPAKPDGMLWLLGSDFPEKQEVIEELSDSNALIAVSPNADSHVLVCFVDENLASKVRKHLANKAFDEALRLGQVREWTDAIRCAERMFDLGGISNEGAEERVALLSLLYKFGGRKRRSAGYLEMALNSRGRDFYERTLEKYRELYPKVAPDRGRPKIASLIIFFALAALTSLVVLGAWTIPSNSDFSLPENKDSLLRKLSATILVYFMQFGFIAFEAGYVRQNYRRHSAVKNLIVFAISFISYTFLGWRLQRYINSSSISNPLDIAFNAGFASTVSLIIANTITERGTLLVNSVCSIVAAGLAYPFLAGRAFDNGAFTDWGFIDTAGGCVVHVLGGMFGLAAALWIGPRAKRRSWYLLGKVQMADQRDQIPFAVIGAFFLWFGWLGFNSGNANSWDAFLVAFANTNIGASAGGLVGLIVAVISMGMLTTTASTDLSRGGALREILREIANLERVMLGMLGGLVAVTANASLVKPWQALVEAMIGASVAIVGSALIVHYKERLDDPLGAIATHGFAGTVGVICTAFFYRKEGYSQLGQLSAQALGCVIAALTGWFLASIACGFLWGVERLRRGSEWWLYGKSWRLTPYEQQTGRTGTEFSVPAEDIERARRRVRAGPPVLQRDGDKSWIDAVAVLALSERSDEELKELFTALDRVLEANYQGSPEEQTALAAIGARADVTKLLMCVNRTLAHRGLSLPPGGLEWRKLDPLYTETLIVTISELAESFAASYRLLRVVKSRLELRDMVEGFVKACDLLKEIGQEREEIEREVIERGFTGGLARSRALVRSRAWKNFLYLKKLPWYKEIIEMHKIINAES